MAVALDHDTDLDFVRHQLDVLSAARYMNGLNAAGERHYHRLCALEQHLLEVRVLESRATP